MSGVSSRKEAANWKTYTPESFCNYINYGKTIPLTPSSETIVAVRNWCAKEEVDFEEFAVLSEMIRSYWDKLNGRYLLIDMQYLSSQVHAYLSKVVFPSGEEGELCQLLKEELENIICNIGE